ncbi:MAG: glycosyltransferase [Anaerolineaceae bacterium]|nr:glycosyltransferase [Anaerolineaceae bacterium]
MPEVSVIIPVYNSEKTICETIDSVLAQTYQDFEIIVVDDGSTDKSKELIQSYGSKAKYIYQENGGQASARNTAIRASSGNILAFLDSDDLWLPQKLEKQLRAMSRQNTDWCYCDCEYFIDETEEVLGKYSDLLYPAKQGWVADKLILGNFIASPTPIVSRSLFEKAGYFDESAEIKSREDWEEWIRIAMLSKVVYVPEILTRHRIHQGSITFQEYPAKAFSSHFAVINKITEMFPNELGKYKEKALSFYAMRFSRSHWLRGDINAARSMISQAVAWQPQKIQYQLWKILYHFPGWILNSIIALRNRIRGD